MRLFSFVVSVIALVAGLIPAAMAQEKFPVRPVELIVPWGPGGGADQLGRKAGLLMEGDLKVSIPVVNAPGATGNSGMAKMLAGNADGYAMAILIADTLATLATGSAKWKLTDVNPLGVMVRQPSGLFVKQDSRFKSWNDVVASRATTPDGTCVRDYIHVSDLAAAHALSLDYLRASNQSTAINLGNGHGYSVLEVIESARTVTGREIPIDMQGRRAGDPSHLVADAAKARAVLGWQPQHADLAAIIGSAWKWQTTEPSAVAPGQSENTLEKTA